ncbi:MAG: cytochrome c peroxidase, partial [Gemmatimonadota bacterium]
MALAACGEQQTMEPTAPTAPPISASVGLVKADLASVGESVFMDKNLSINRNQSCSTCHSPDWGWSNPLVDIAADGAVMTGSIAGRT